MSDAPQIHGNAKQKMVFTDVGELPVRMTTKELLALARFSRATLLRRQKDGRFPRSIEPGIYRRDDVLAALGLSAR